MKKISGVWAQRLLLASCAVIAACGSAYSADSYYVSSSSGNDAWSGLQASPNSANSDGPFKTLARAQSAMRASSVKRVYVRNGTYSVRSRLTLTPEDNNEAWFAYSNEQPVLDGGNSGNVVFANPRGVIFQGFTLQNFNSDGLYLNYGQSLQVRRNKFVNCPGQFCISGNGVQNSVIDSNTINGGATNAAISLWYGSSNNTISHNLIQNTSGGGIHFGTGPSDPPANNNTVDRNLLKNIASSGGYDTGAVYMVDLSQRVTGNKITNNVILGVGGSSYQSNLTKGIYLDDGMSNVTVTGNICRNCGYWEFQIHAGDHNVFKNNIFDMSQSKELVGIYQTLPPGHSGDEGMNGNVFQQNIIYFGVTPPSDSIYFVNINPNDALPYDTNNLYYSAKGGTIVNGQGMVDSHPVFANPEFASPSSGNYSMPSSSPAYSTIGFQKLPTDQGPQ